MPTIDENRSTWQDAEGGWWQEGDEWSVEWGGAESEWWSTLYPRLRNFLPTDHLVEIAPGFGRWTHYLLPLCKTYVGVDLTPRCVEACTARFASIPHADFRLNDGKTLTGVDDRSVDVVFSFDSLVHVELDVLDAYLREISRVLTADGVAVIHHSNAGAYKARLRRNQRVVARQNQLPRALRRGLDHFGLLDRDHWRAYGPTADAFARLAEESGLSCVGQELVPWGVRRVLLDSISVVTRPGSKWDRPRQVVENWSFMAAAQSAACAARTYPSPTNDEQAH